MSVRTYKKKNLENHTPQQQYGQCWTQTRLLMKLFNPSLGDMIPLVWVFLAENNGISREIMLATVQSHEMRRLKDRYGRDGEYAEQHDRLAVLFYEKQASPSSLWKNHIDDLDFSTL
jgi:hypothetical protein